MAERDHSASPKPASAKSDASAKTAPAQQAQPINPLYTWLASSSPSTFSGAPLAAGDREFFGDQFGRDFSNVTLHTDSAADRAAQELDARAFTAGDQVYFAAGEYSPNTLGGRHLLAHELAHVAQQPGRVMRSKKGDPAPGADSASLSQWPATLIVEDDVAASERQQQKSLFLESLRTPLMTMIDEELKGTAWSSRDCPWLVHYLESFRSRPVDVLHRQIRYHLTEPIPTSVDELRARIVERMRQGVHEWRALGSAPRILRDIPAIGLISDVGAIATGVFSLFRKAEPGASAGPEHSRALMNLSPGRPLDGSSRARMESAFGADLSHVELHTDASGAALAREQNAQAVAIGSHVAFAPERYAPGTPRGDALLAHEIAHTFQQKDGVGAGGAATEDLEREADQGAAAAVLGLRAHAGRSTGLSFQRCGGGSGFKKPARQDEIEADPNYTAPTAIKDLPKYEAPKLEAKAPTLPMRLSGADASARVAAIEELRARPTEPRSWTLVLIASGSSFPDTKAAAQALVATWLKSNAAFREFVVLSAAAPEGELGDLAVAALMSAGRGASVDIENYRRVIIGRLELVTRLRNDLQFNMQMLVGSMDATVAFLGSEVAELTKKATTADAAALGDIGIRASRLLQRYGLVQREIEVMSQNFEGAAANPELAKVIKERMTLILLHAGSMKSDADDLKFQEVIKAIEGAPAAFVTVMLDSVRTALVDARKQVVEIIKDVGDSKAAAGVRDRVVTPVQVELDRAIELLDGARSGIAANPAAVFDYLTQIGESMVSLQERVFYAVTALDATIRTLALAAPTPTDAKQRAGVPGSNKMMPMIDPNLVDKANAIDKWDEYARAFELFAKERDKNPAEIQRRVKVLFAGRDDMLKRFEIYYARNQADWQFEIISVKAQWDAMLILLSLTPARVAGTGARAFLGWLLGRFGASLAGRFLIGATVLGVEGTVFHFTHEGLRTLAYGEEFWDEDFTTNWAMSVALFGAMGGSNRVYSRLTANAIKGGGTLATVARAGSVALEFGVLQSFGVIAERIHSGKWVLPNNPKFWAMAMHNVAFMGALHIGGHAVKPINEAILTRVLRPFARSFNARAGALNTRIADWMNAGETSFDEAGRIIRQSKTLNAERLHLARAMREATPDAFKQEDLTYVQDLVGTLDSIADRALYDASIGLRPHESAPNVFYFDGDVAKVKAEYEARGYKVLEQSDRGRMRMQEPGGGFIELLQIGRTARSFPSGIKLDATTRAELQAELIRLGDPARETRKLSDDALIARHQGVMRGGIRGEIYELAPTAVLDEAARVQLLADLGADYATGGGPMSGARFGTSDPRAQRLVVPLAGGGEVTAVVTTKLGEVKGGGAHGRSTGPARVTLRRRPDGTWTVDVLLDPRLQPNDAASALKHEIGEAARIIQRLAKETTLSEAALKTEVERQQRASLMREGATSTEMSDHDIESVHELGRLLKSYRADPTPVREAQLSEMLRRMGFQHRRFGYVARRAAIVEHLPPPLASDLTVYLEGWYLARAGVVPLAPIGRSKRYTEILDYTQALNGLRGATDAKSRAPYQAALDRIQALARAAHGETKLTREALVEEHYPSADIDRVLREAGSGNPYENLHAELESLMDLRATIASGGGFGEAVTIDSVTAVAGRGRGATRVEGSAFEHVLARLQAAVTAGKLTSMTPSVSPTGGSMSESIRLTWVFKDNSTFNIDLPGVNAQRSAGYEINRVMHGNFETAAVSGGGTQHVTETGITVPADTAPAHMRILVDAVFQAQMRAWGANYDYGRFPPGR